ncbi:hypothetical protein AAVH_01636 [Aphelenchoides avenae]|nr:hypothetical protein AAVH_01636 [Aphelenchus avenae]
MHKLSHCTLRTSISSLKLSAIYHNPRQRAFHDALNADEKRDKALLSELRDVQRLHANYYLAFTNWQKRLLAAKPPPDPETVKFLQNTWESFSLTEDGEPDPEAVIYRPRKDVNSNLTSFQSDESASEPLTDEDAEPIAATA